MPCIEVNYVITYTDVAGVALTVYRTELQMPEVDRSLISFLFFFIYFFLFYLFDQQSEYTAFHKLMCCKSPDCGLSDAVRSPPARGSLTPDYRSVGHLRFSFRGILSLDIVCRSGFG